MSAKQGTSKGSKDGATPPLGHRVLGALMTILDTTIVAVAIDTLSRDLGVSLPTIQWVSTAYMLALATVIPLTGWAIDRFGAKRLWMVSVALFAVVLQHQIAFGLTQTRGGGVAAAESVPPGLLSDPANEGHVRAGANGGRLAYALWEKDGAKPGRRERHRRRRIADPVRAQRPRRNIGKEKGTEQTHLRHVVGWIDR